MRKIVEIELIHAVARAAESVTVEIPKGAEFLHLTAINGKAVATFLTPAKKTELEERKFYILRKGANVKAAWKFIGAYHFIETNYVFEEIE